MINWKSAAKTFWRRNKNRTEDWCDGFDDGVSVGRHEAGAVLGGLLGMAFAIQEWERGRQRREDDAAYERTMAKMRGE